MNPVGQPPGDEDATASEERSVVDPAVLAERRARRAEIAEESLLSRVNRAEQDRVLLATRLAEAEHELQRARTEQETLAAELQRREIALRTAEQREFAEQQRRVEAEDEAAAARRTGREELDALRRRLADAEERVHELTVELEQARREAVEAARVAAHERARSSRRETGGGERRALLAEQEEDLRRRVAEVERLEQQAREAGLELDRRRESLEAEIVALQSFADELDGTLRAERERRAALEDQLAAERERAAAEITLLQHELDRRTQERDAASAERERLLVELEAVRGELANARAGLAERERLLQEPRTAADAVALQGRLDAERASWRAHEEQLGIELETERQRGRDELRAREEALRTELEVQRQEFAQRVADLEARASGLHTQVHGATEELEARLVAERVAKEAAIAALEQERGRVEDRAALEREALTAERDRLAVEADAARAEAQRARQDAAEATAAHEALVEELRRRVELEHQVRDAITELRGRLQEVDAQEAARVERDAAVEALVAELVDTAATLRAGFEQELEETRRRLRGQVEEERLRFAHELEAMEERIAALRGQLGGAAEELREQLEAERIARHALEAQLEAERAAHREDRELAAEAGRVREELERELAARVASEAAAREALETVRAELDRVRAAQDAAEAQRASALGAPQAAPEEPEAPLRAPARLDVADLDADTAALIGDLQAAADRLRSRVAHTAAAETAVPPAAPADEPASSDGPDAAPPVTAAAGASTPVSEDAVLRELEEIAAGRVPVTPEPPTAAAGTRATAAPVEAPPADPPAVADGADRGADEPSGDASSPPLAAGEDGPDAVASPVGPAPVLPAVPSRPSAGTPRFVDLVAAGGPPTAWLGPALVAAAATDPALAARVLPAVLATHAQRSRRDLAYDVTVGEGETWHVRLKAGTATVDRRDAGTGGDVDFAVRGPLASIVAFAAGGTGRRPGDLHVGGRRRRLRRLVKDLRTPVGIAEIAAAGVPVQGGDLLRLLAAAVDPAAVTGPAFAVDYALADGSTLHVAVDGAVRVDDGPASGGAVARVDLDGRTLPALLGGAVPPPGERVALHGDGDAAERLHRLFHEAQGLRR